MKVLGIIPARYASTRFPGKPLASICGKPMIEWVYQNATQSKLLDDLIVATDNERIENAVKQFGGKVVMTNPEHLSGTDRCAEVVQLLGKNYDIILNIQGDEPLVKAAEIDTLIHLLQRDAVEIGTLVYPSYIKNDLINPNRVKVLFKNDGIAFRFGRLLPNVRLKFPIFLHKGMYGFKTQTLLKIVQLPPTKNELAEKLEQLRWLDHQYPIHSAKVKDAGIGVDTLEDIKIIEELMGC